METLHQKKQLVNHGIIIGWVIMGSKLNGLLRKPDNPNHGHETGMMSVHGNKSKLVKPEGE